MPGSILQRESVRRDVSRCPTAWLLGARVRWPQSLIPRGVGRKERVRWPGRRSRREHEEEGSHDNPQGGEARRVAQSTEEAPGEGEGVHPTARSAEPGAPRTALGARREVLQLRGRAGDAGHKRPATVPRTTG